MSMEIYLVIFVLFLDNFALLEAKTPLVIGKLLEDKFCSWMFCFGMRTFDVQADRKIDLDSNIIYGNVFVQKDA